MKSTLPPLNALRTFEVAARLGSFSAAAAELFVTHGAVSRQIKLLEAWLGQELFIRLGRRVQLNAAGLRYVQEVRNGFDTIARATETIRLSQGGRKLVINAIPTLAMHWLLPKLSQFQRLFPDIELRLATSDRDILNIAHGFDVAIRRGPIDLPGFISKVFMSEWELPLCSPALLKHNPINTAADLANHTLLYADTRPNSWPRWLGQAGELTLSPSASQHFNHFYLALQAAMDGLGVCLGPMPMMQSEIDSGRLCAPLSGPLLAVSGYCWVVPQALAEDATIQSFCTWLEGWPQS